MYSEVPNEIVVVGWTEAYRLGPAEDHCLVNKEDSCEQEPTVHIRAIQAEEVRWVDRIDKEDKVLGHSVEVAARPCG